MWRLKISTLRNRTFSISYTRYYDCCFPLFKKKDRFVPFTRLLKHTFYERFDNSRDREIYLYTRIKILLFQMCPRESNPEPLFFHLYIYILGEFKRFRNNAAAGWILNEPRLTRDPFKPRISKRDARNRTALQPSPRNSSSFIRETGKIQDRISS